MSARPAGRYPTWRAASTRRAPTRRLPRVLRGAVRHRRAEHDRLPPAGGGTVRALGRADAGRLHVRREDAAHPARPRRRRSSSGCRPSATGSARSGSSSRARATTGCWSSSSARCRPTCSSRWDFRDPSWDDVDGIVRVDDFDAEPFRYIRLREPPYTDDDLRAVAERLRPPAFVYLRHEDAPTAPGVSRDV